MPPEHHRVQPQPVLVDQVGILQRLRELAAAHQDEGLAAPLEQCAQLLGVDLATVRELAAKVEPYLHADSTRISSLTQLERLLRPELYSRRRGGYLGRRRTRQ